MNLNAIASAFQSNNVLMLLGGIFLVWVMLTYSPPAADQRKEKKPSSFVEYQMRFYRWAFDLIWRGYMGYAGCRMILLAFEVRL